MKKKELFYKYTEFTIMQNIGSGWINQIKSYIPYTQILSEIAIYQVVIWGFHLPIPTYILTIFLIIKYYLMMVINFFIGKLAKKIGLVKAQSDYGSKHEQLSPFNHQLMNTVGNICKKLDVKNEFEQL